LDAKRASVMLNQEKGLHLSSQPCKSSHLSRPRINALLTRATKNPLVIVCAGAGYGKTSAVFDFLRSQKLYTAWIQLQEQDNLIANFWENYIGAIAPLSKSLASELRELGFPDTEEKLSQYLLLMHRAVSNRKYLVVLDNFHLIKDPAVIRFVERTAHDRCGYRSLILISRKSPQITIASMLAEDLVASLDEEDLSFNEAELNQFLRSWRLNVEPQSLRDILEDTKGWAFAVNLVARSLQKSRGYVGYTRNAIENNIFQMMEAEAFKVISVRLRHFLVCLSLVGHLTIDLVLLLADKDESLLAELERESAYIRFNTFTNAYVIHHLFLCFLRSKQTMLTVEERKNTYRIAAGWYNQNSFTIDALTCYEKADDYPSLLAIFMELPMHVPQDIAGLAMDILSRAPAEAFDRVLFLAAMHVRFAMCLNLWAQAYALAKEYEAKFLSFSTDDAFRNRSLGCLYYCLGIIRFMLCTQDDIYDFDTYFAKQYDCLAKHPVNPGKLACYPMGPWFSRVGSAKKDAPAAFNAVMNRSVWYVTRCFGGGMAGADDAVRGELLFYQADFHNAEALFACAFKHARESGQFEIAHRTLIYLLRIAALQGNYARFEQMLKNLSALLGEKEYAARFTTYHIALGWYYYILRQPERIPDWLKQEDMPQNYAYRAESLVDQIKAHYFYLVKDYTCLLTYIEERKRQNTVLYDRLEMLVLEACVQYHMKDKEAAVVTLGKAYAAALPNGILTPFIALGKDMRTLIAYALREPDPVIPHTWLETVLHKSATYAKRGALIIGEYEKEHGSNGEPALSARETEVLRDLYNGLSRSEIAADKSLSINTIKQIINSIFVKLKANSIVDVVRIAAERKLV